MCCFNAVLPLSRLLERVRIDVVKWEKLCCHWRSVARFYHRNLQMRKAEPSFFSNIEIISRSVKVRNNSIVLSEADNFWSNFSGRWFCNGCFVAHEVLVISLALFFKWRQLFDVLWWRYLLLTYIQRWRRYFLMCKPCDEISCIFYFHLHIARVF